MKTYEIEVERVTYITYTVFAEDEDAAEQACIGLAENDYGSDATYKVTEIEETV